MSAQSTLLTDAQRAIVDELDSQETAARSAWVAAQERTATAIAEEQAALTALNIATEASRAMRDVLSRICAGYNAPAQPQPVGKSKAGSLTADVLSEIFQFAIDMYDPDGENSDALASPAFLTSAVSRHWRHVAIRTPALWSKIRLRLPKQGHLDLKAYLGTLLSRTRNELLDVVLLDAPVNDRVQRLSREDEAALVDVFSRCSSLRLGWDDLDIHYLQSFLPILQAPMPHLVTFRFLCDLESEFTLQGAPDNLRLLSLCPKLRHLDLVTLPFKHIVPESMPMLESFRVVSVVTASQTLAMARAWPKLRSLEVRHVSRQQVANGGPPAHFGALTDINCEQWGHNILQNLTAAQMPVLKDLTLCCYAPGALRIFGLFISSPGPCTSLTTLNLQGHYAQAAYPAFSAVPNLATLRLSGLQSDGVLRMFTDWAATDGLIVHPHKLRNLHFEDCDFGDNASHALLAFVEARKGFRSEVVSAICELSLVQTGNCETRDDVFEPWMAARVQQLVEHVTIDTARAYPSALI